MEVNCIIDGEYIRIVIVRDGKHQSIEIHQSRPEALATVIKGAYESGKQDGYTEGFYDAAQDN